MAKGKGISLTPDMVKRLKLEAKPVGLDDKGKIMMEPNPEGKEYFVFCSHRDSPQVARITIDAIRRD